MATLLSSEPLLVWFLVVLVLCANAGLGTIGCIKREKHALLHFKHGLVDEYGLLSSWGDEKNKSDCCRWRGVHCSKRSGHVVKLHLPAPPTDQENNLEGGDLSLRGKISHSLLKLEHLTLLDLSYNDFEGTLVPSFLASLTQLQYLHLSHANFSGPLAGQLANLSNLLSLDLSYNYGLDGGNLEWLPHLSSLRHLDLGGVSLSKAIHWPQAIDQLPSLIHLNLIACGLPLPTTSSLSHVNSSAPLTFLDISYNNDLASSIYPWVFNFRSTLVHLGLCSCGLNVLRGEIGESFGNMSSLEYLDMHNNELEGSIPDAFGNIQSLTYLDLSSNQLQGSIPKSFGNMSSLRYLVLFTNLLQGSIPYTIGNLASLEELYLDDNQLQGSIPETVGHMSSLKYLCLPGNRLQGSIPGTVGHMSSLTYLDLSHNQLQGSIPEAFGNLTSLDGLYLSHNKLEGEIPMSFKYLCSLQTLHMQNNTLSGQLPKDFLSCSNERLYLLYLFHNKVGGSIPHFIGFSSLRELSLGFNQMNGTFPESIGQLTKLEVLNVSSNSLQGTISEVHLLNLSQLSSLDLSSNRLTFNISSKWVPPFQLYYLALSSSKLGPYFPHWLRNQKDMGEIDISNCEISDVIPDWFWNLTYPVATLNVSNNQIKGTLPDLSSKFEGPIYIDMSSNHLESSIPQLPFWLNIVGSL